ncbi:HlyD family secretion protein [Altericroceibacterium spongiae]|uniref:HlyD family secretion protein n=1 Tax=Altericroceibacterium spongiae TaxID=2320269 RepID=A0A420EM49_9SPHN|nr:HlyD family secretion protein [Altericroceibacterium spongiae]RKF21753.1 HlyD family secretion protein [Altericroceibacterium spongiae]
MNDKVEDNSIPEDAAPAEEKKTAFQNPKVRRGLLIAAVVLVLVGIAWFVRYELVGKYMENTDDAYVQADAVTIAPKVSGYIDEVLVEDNQTVKKGDPLVRIDPRDYRAQAQQAQAQIDVAKANANAIRAQMGEQRAAVQQAEAQLAKARSDLAFAQSEVARYEPLVKSGAEPGQILNQRRNQADQARAAVKNAEAGLAAAQRRLGTLQAQVAQAEAQGEANTAQLDEAEVNVGSTVIRSSIDGRIGNKTVRVGQFVQPGLRLMSVVPTDNLYITANFKETQVALMRPGQPATIEVDALDGVELHGRVASFSPGTGAQFSLLPPENATGNFTKIVQRIPVRIAIDASSETQKLLVPGMSVVVTVDTRSAEGELEQIEERQEERTQAAD